MRKLLIAALLPLLGGCGGGARSGITEIRIPTGAGGVGFLPLLVMQQHQLVEKHAREAGIEARVEWINLGGPAVMNDALLSGSVDFIAAGPPAFLTLWDRTVDSVQVKGVAAMTSLPMYLNTTAGHLRTLDDIRQGDKIGITAIKVSIPALIMQMYARQKYGAGQVERFDKYTVSIAHPDGVIAMLSGSDSIDAHFTSPPFHQRERKDPRIRTVMTSDDVMGGSTTFTMISTTAKFREENPRAYQAVLSALEEANEMILADKPAAAELLLASTGGGGERGFSVDEIVEVLNDPDIRFTTTPENMMKYAEFMNETGSIRNRPESWKDLFFPEIHGAPGG